jgi:two-component system, cell cycle sensor histidine kinase and response regulator CckA
MQPAIPASGARAWKEQLELNPSRIKVLLIEDNPGDAELIRSMLAEAKGMCFEAEWRGTLSEGLKRLSSGGIDVVLLDLGLPDSSGLETLRRLHATSRPTQVVVVVFSGQAEEEMVFQALQQGAQDYLIKGRVDSSIMVRSIRYAMERSQALEALHRARSELEDRVRERTAELVKANDALRESQNLLQEIIDNSNTVIFMKDLGGRYVLINRRFEQLFHVTLASMVGKTDYDLFPRDRAERFRAFDQLVLANKRVMETEELVPHEDGDHTYISVKAPLLDKTGTPYAVCGIATDITEWKRLQEQLRQSQKMEAVGRLAGGVAHDFNNLLAIIIGYGELLRGELSDRPSLRDRAEQITKAAGQAAAVTRKLLTFSRRNMPQPQPIQLNELLRDLEKILRSVVSEDIELSIKPDPGVGLIRSEPSQIEQVILNLVLNACDAMPQGGKLTLLTESESIDEEHARIRNAQPGRYVHLTVTDTGYGMDLETQARIFEPFFTTKAEGKGTGLGLSTVYGTIQQAGGFITVQSRLGEGTTFHVHLPQIEMVEAGRSRPPETVPAGGSETILLVEDQNELRRLISEVLLQNGYMVLQAGQGQEALDLLRNYSKRIHLMITDLVMPQMGGRELAHALAPEHPEIKVLYISGYPDDAIRQDEISSSSLAFISKPFGPDALLQKVREILHPSEKPTRLRQSA